MKKIALLPGGFKPPHAGHYGMAKYLLQNTDANKVVIKVGAKTREGVDQDTSVGLWNYYIKTDPEVPKGAIVAEPSIANSPVRDVYDYVDHTARQGDIIYLARGEKDEEDQRFANIYKYSDGKGVIVKTVLVPPQAEGISGTEMRGLIQSGGKEALKSYLPSHLDDNQKEEVWNMLSKNLNESMKIGKDGNLIGMPNPPDTSKIKSSISKITNWCEMMVEAYPSEDPHGRGWEVLPLSINDISDVIVMHGNGVFKLPESEYRNEMKEMYIRITPDDGEVAILLWTKNQSLNIFHPELIGDTYENGIISLKYKGKLIGYDFSRDINYEYGEDDYIIERNLNESLPPLPKSKRGYGAEHWRSSNPNPKDNSKMYPINMRGVYRSSMYEGKGRKLRVYDFDDTIANTRGAFIKIKHADGSMDRLDPAEYAIYNPQKGDKFDFSEFDKMITDATPIAHIVGLLKNDLSNPSNKVTILTARMLAFPVRRYLKSIGIDAYVVAVGSSDPLDKSRWIEKHIDSGYNDIYFVDDSEKNRDAVSALKDKHPDINLTVEDPDKISEMMAGTMNKAEMAKHAKNMKRLSKDLRKQGDQYVKVPSYVHGTLTRKLSEGVSKFRDLYDASPPELQKIVMDQRKAAQHPEWHPEGNTLKHIITVTNRAIKNHPDNMDVIMAAYFHDLGKLATFGTHPKTGHPTAYGHEKVSTELAENYSDFIREMGADPENVKYIVASHMKVKPRTWDVMRQAKKDKISQHSSYEDLGRLAKVDRGGLDLQEKLNEEKEEKQSIIGKDSIPNLERDESAFKTTKKPIPLDFRIVDKEETIKTLEGPVVAQKGDFVMTGTEGENWPIPKDNFKATYNIVEKGKASKNETEVYAKQLEVPSQVKVDWSDSLLTAKPGDYLVQYGPKDYGVVDQKIFDQTYLRESATFSKAWWKEKINEVMTEAKANTHLTHLEELILTQGQDGYNQAKSLLIELLKTLKGHSNSKVNTSVKWDGAPALFAGINPENGKFFVGTKSIFNKNPKLNYTKEDIDTNHGHAPGLADKLKKALIYLPSLGIKNILQGDFMFDNSTISTKEIDGTAHYTFKPNTITYAVEANSDLGAKITTADFGIIFHTTYNDLSGGASFGADISGLKKNPKIWFDDAWFDDDTGTVTITPKESEEVLEKIKQADQIKVNYENVPSELLNTYINSEKN